MTNKSKDLDLIPAIKPAKDEVASYRRNSRSEAPKQSSFNGLLVFALVMMAIMMGLGGYTLYELQLQLEVSNNLLQKADDERTRLEEELAVSGVKSSNAFRKMDDRQKTNTGEIRKLWAIAHQQNKPKIEGLEKSVVQLERSSRSLTGNITGFTRDLNRVSGDFKRLSEDMVEVRQNLIDDNNEMTTQVAVVRGQIQAQTDVVESNKRNFTSTIKTVKRLEEDIETFDRYRQQTNKKLLDLQRQLREQTTPAVAGG